ncbi:MAG: hypothetical protein JNL11_16295 [Bdellovibrionaceae bacterium]|nr:hypothetical protein [Pseudobdellovibrionaceae bacterium]
MGKSSQIKVKRLVRSFQTAVILVCALVVYGQGCAEGGFYPQGSADIASTLNASCKDPNEIEVIPGAKTASLAGANQIVHHFAACTGLESISGSTKAVYEEKSPSMSTYGAVNTVTGPYLMSVHSVAGEVCNDVIDQEIARGTRLFAGWNLSSSSLPSQSQLANAALNFSLSCWKDYELSNEERDIVVDAVVSSVNSNEVDASRKAAVIICTSMLASLNALLN